MSTKLGRNARISNLVFLADKLTSEIEMKP